MTYLPYGLSLASQGQPLNVQTIFMSLALLQLFVIPLGKTMQYISNPLIVGIVSLNRVDDFLRSPDSSSLSPELELNDEKSQKELQGLLLSGVAFSYGTNKQILENLNLEISQGTLNIIQGAVGVGKSTLLRILAKELQPTGGKMQSQFQRMAYCSQAPWIFTGTLRDNVTGCQATSDLDREWLNTVLHATCLNHDLAAFQDGEDLLISDAGSSLSGGQKTRIVRLLALITKLMGLGTGTSALLAA
jgi:ATP-binding cassette, subfamily C (CFTR/MRP), member 1